MRRIERYLARLFLGRLAVTAFGLVGLLGVLDALGSADILPPDAGLNGSLRYMVLRMPILFDRVLVFALLLAILLTYAALIRRNEVVALAASGMSVFGQVRALIPAVVLATLAAALLIDRVSPAATRALEDWLGAAALREDSRAPEALWLAEDRWLVEIAGLDRGRLTGLTLFERTGDGRIASVSRATSAEARIGGWTLSGVTQVRYDGRPLDPPAVWATTQTPATLRLLLSEPRDLGVGSLVGLAEMTRSGNRPSSAYRVWLLNRLALPLVGVGLVLLAVPIMHRTGRRENGYAAMAVALVAGFAFILADGLFKAFAESGNLGAVTAVAVPLGALMLAGLVLAWRKAATG